MTQEHWDGANARCFGMLLDGWAQQTGIVRRGSGANLLHAYNAHFDVVNFTLPLVAEGRSWDRLLDTKTRRAANNFRLPRRLRGDREIDGSVRSAVAALEQNEEIGGKSYDTRVAALAEVTLYFRGR